MKKIIALLLAMIMVLALAACAAKTEPAQAETTAETTAPAETAETTETAAPADGFKVAISLAEYNEWNKLYEAVIKEKCDEWGWTYEIFDSKQDASTQIDQVNSIIAQGFNAMTIQAVDNAGLKPAWAICIIAVEVAICFAVVTQISLPTAEVATPALAISFAHFFVGLTCIISQRNIMKQIFGYCLMENGSHVTLALLAPTAPEIIEIGIATDAIFAVIIMSIVVRRIWDDSHSLDARDLSELRG